MDITRAGGDLPSRVADNLYWLGRYMERAEDVCRLARGITVRLTDQNFESSPELSLLMNTLLNAATQGDASPGILQHPEEQLTAVLLEDSYRAGLHASLTAVYRNASLVRDRISPDTWRIINSFDRELPAAGRGAGLSEILPALDRLIITFAAFGGLAMESMTRGYAWRFLDMGRRIERALATVHLLRGALVHVPQREAPLLEAVLEIADSAMTYRRRYMTALQAAPVLDLLLADESNPRSAAFQLARLAEHIEALPRHGVVHSGIAASMAGGGGWSKPTTKSACSFGPSPRSAWSTSTTRSKPPANDATTWMISSTPWASSCSCSPTRSPRLISPTPSPPGNSPPAPARCLPESLLSFAFCVLSFRNAQLPHPSSDALHL